MNQISSGKAMVAAKNIPLVARKPYSDVGRASNSKIMDADFVVVVDERDPVIDSSKDQSVDSKNSDTVEDTAIVFKGEGLLTNFISFAIGCAVMYAITYSKELSVVAAIVAASPINLIVGMLIESKFMICSKWKMFLNKY